MRTEAPTRTEAAGFTTGTTYGRVLPRRGYVPPVVRPRPAIPGAPPPAEPAAVVDWIVRTFETQGRAAGLAKAAEYDATYRTGGVYLEGAAAYLAARAYDRQLLEQRIAEHAAELASAALLRERPLRAALLHPMHASFLSLRRYRAISARRRFLERRLMALPTQRQAVADLPDVPKPKGRPEWLPYLSLGLAVAGFTLALSRGKK